jgi:hypothetical protein
MSDYNLLINGKLGSRRSHDAGHQSRDRGGAGAMFTGLEAATSKGGRSCQEGVSEVGGDADRKTAQFRWPR